MTLLPLRLAMPNNDWVSFAYFFECYSDEPEQIGLEKDSWGRLIFNFSQFAWDHQGEICPEILYIPPSTDALSFHFLEDVRVIGVHINPEIEHLLSFTLNDLGIGVVEQFQLVHRQLSELVKRDEWTQVEKILTGSLSLLLSSEKQAENNRSESVSRQEFNAFNPAAIRQFLRWSRAKAKRKFLKIKRF